MAESKRRLGKVKGVVLVMVVTIMFVLMIMLLATLAVVSSTTRRTYTKYEENQAYYTSRSVLEVFIKQYLEDKDKPSSSDDAVADEIVSLMSKHFNSISKNDLRAKNVDPDGTVTYGDYQDFTGAAISNGFYFQQQIFGNLTPKYEWNGTYGNPTGTMNFADDKYWTVRADAETNPASYSVEFEVELPDLTGTGSNNAGLFANKDGTGKQTAKIKVEMLRVMFISDDMSDWTDYRDGKKIDFQKVNWKKTYYRMKVSATTELGQGDSDSEITVSVILEPTKEAGDPPTDGPKLSVYTTSTTNADNKIKIIGGSGLTNSGKTTTFNNSETSLMGNIVYDSNFRISAMHSDQWSHGRGESMVIHGGWLSMSNSQYKIEGYGALSATSTDDLSERPFIYARGAKFYKVTAGSNSAAIDILCGDPMNSGTDTKFIDEAGLSWASVPTDAKDRIAFVTSEANNKFYGDIYVDGDMYLGGNADEFYGNIYCTGTIYIAYDNEGQGPRFHKDVSCADIKCNSASASNKNSFLKDGATYSAASTFSLKWDETKYISADDPKHANQMKFNVPKRGDVYCNTTKQSESVYSYKALGITPTPGNGKTENDVVTAEDYFKYISGSDKSKLNISASAAKVTGYSVGNLSDEYGDYTGVKILNTSGSVGQSGFVECQLSLADFGNEIYFINATNDAMQIQLTNDGFHNMTAHSPTFIVVGDKSVMFTVADNTNFQAGSMAVYNSQIYQMIIKKEKMYVGSEPAQPVLPAAPQIQYFIGDNSTFEFSNPGNFCLTGYIYGGYADLKLDSQTNDNDMHKADINYNGKDVGWTSHCSVFGSATFKSIQLQQIETFVYISPSNKKPADGGATGGRIIWGRQKYLNKG